MIAAEHFLESIDSYVSYWDNLPHMSTEERMRGLAFSILVMIDGEADMPPFKLIPHEGYPLDDDEENGKEYPQEDIAGDLHGEWARRYMGRRS